MPRLALIIAESSDIEPALHDFNSSTVKTLARWLMVTQSEFDVLFDKINIYTAGKKISPMILSEKIREHSSILILGRVAEREVLKSIKKSPRHFFNSEQYFVILPHPSGKNRVLNDAEIREHCKKLCERLMNRIRRGLKIIIEKETFR